LIRTILFDFGNVVAFFDHARAVKQLAAFTAMPPVELALQLYGSPIEDAYERGRLSTAEYVREAKLNGRLSCTDGQFLAAFVDIFWANAGVLNLIPKLKAAGYRLVLASNTNDAHFRKYTEQFADAIRQFDHLGTSHAAGARKPEPAFFAHLQQFAGAEPGECLFIDDLPVNVEAARQHGWNGIVYRDDAGLAAELARFGVRAGG
jgi:putative hydrolase of the HAD superfamily